MDTACRRGEQDARSPTSPKGQDRQRRNVHNIFILTSSSTMALKLHLCHIDGKCVDG